MWRVKLLDPFSSYLGFESAIAIPTSVGGMFIWFLPNSNNNSSITRNSFEDLISTNIYHLLLTIFCHMASPTLDRDARCWISSNCLLLEKMLDLTRAKTIMGMGPVISLLAPTSGTLGNNQLR